MKTTKHFALMALLVLGATLYASTPARAAPFDLTPTGAEPGATGQGRLAHVELVDYSVGGQIWIGPPPSYQMHWQYEWYTYSGELSVACQGLTPGATYRTSAGTFIADRYGRGKAKTTDFSFTYGYEWGRLISVPQVEVYRVNRDGSETLVLAGW